MGLMCGEEMEDGVVLNGAGGKDRILVSVRLRPLNEREIAANDPGVWECINDTTIIFRNSLAERSMIPTAYTFDRVFRGECNTKQVYEDAAKEVALSVVSGINSTIFAYGQTSSGKTFTMTGITEYTVADIFDYIRRHEERAFVLKLSAIEIYNEAVRDLLSTDSTPLRLLDDPERGTIVEKLTEATLRNWNHFKELVSLCEAQRKIGETLLNEASSRSHQIIKLTIESSAREFLGMGNSSTLVASVNFVDLAGSERASQALSAGARLKEGCHINRSLLTLGTVIRKLSNGKYGHIPYRDSKLTRILQPALGGNARTAIICTMCPARSHLEQSRNTLLFASCAKEVATNAQVNVVMSDKALVRHLQREVARLESELRFPGSASSTSHFEVLLKEKDAQIKKLEKEVKELIQQRNLAQSQLENLLQASADDRASRKLEDSRQVSALHVMTSPWEEETEEWNEHRLQCFKELNEQDASSPTFSTNGSKFTGLIPHHSERCQAVEDYEDHCKDVQCIEIDESTTSRSKGTDLLVPGRVQSQQSLTVDQEGMGSRSRPLSQGSPANALEQQLLHVRKTIDNLVKPYHDELSPMSLAIGFTSSRGLTLTKSRSCKASLMDGMLSPMFQGAGQNDYTPPSSFFRDFRGRPEGIQIRPIALNYDAQSEILLGMKEMAQIQHNKQSNYSQAREQAANGDIEVASNRKDVGIDPMFISMESPSRWPVEFEGKQQEIIELWHECNVSLVHRACFFLLFKGDPADSIYMEVELRRLSFLKNTSFSGNIHRAPVQDGPLITPASSVKNLQRERAMLCKQMQKRLSLEERESLYTKWGVSLHTKQRKLQLVKRLWTNTKDMEHIRDSATLVAKLIGILKPGLALREMFGLTFTPQQPNKKPFTWKHITMHSFK
ncbi:Plus-end-directed kinesin ATPase protein [Dioscorea alata]|uniref:Plus-end-directed kinesin ATPase protein n=2 Tax=Dioscorea alata TaxID=55571 RepID=A0ACB7WG96_DIOAL|nr:Plus-end-directed kinesin ATPase protein [Dioscorea alata]